MAPKSASKVAQQRPQTYTEPLGPLEPLSELRKHWNQPVSAWGGFVAKLREFKLQHEILMGNCMCDFSEGLLGLAIVVLFCAAVYYGASKQLHHALDYLMPLVTRQ